MARIVKRFDKTVVSTLFIWLFIVFLIIMTTINKFMGEVTFEYIWLLFVGFLEFEDSRVMSSFSSICFPVDCYSFSKWTIVCYFTNKILSIDFFIFWRKFYFVKKTFYQIQNWVRFSNCVHVYIILLQSIVK